jgi:hypothetical protein
MRHVNRTRLSCSPLEGREVPACIVGLGGPDTLVVSGNAASDAVILRDDGLGNISGFATGHGNFNFSGIKQISVGTGAGPDRVVYQLMRPLQTGQFRNVVVGLGDGNDSFTANLYNANGIGSDLLANSRLQLTAWGGTGADAMTINAQRDVDVAAGAVLKMILFGDAGNDVIRGYYRGENDGAVSIRDFDGGDGNDIIRGLIHEDAGSTGVNAGIVHGGDGDDQLALVLNTLSVPLLGLLDGGAGTDTGVSTANVTKINVP